MMNEQQPVFIKPRVDLVPSYASFIESCVKYRNKRFIAKEIARDPEGFIRRLQEEEQGINQPEGVPQSIFWLVLDDQVIGAACLRHYLTETLMRRGGQIGYGVHPDYRGKGYGTLILKLLLDEARKLGMTRVLLICDEDNPSSARVIEKNGGSLDSEEFLPETNKVIKRYWIEL